MMLRPTTTSALVDILRRTDEPLAVLGTGSLAEHYPIDRHGRLLVSTMHLDGIEPVGPDDRQVRVGAGTLVADLDAALAGAGLECPLDPWWPAATVGGVVASGLSGHRRLGRGSLRHQVLAVEAVTDDGTSIGISTGQGTDAALATIGSWGSVAVITEVVLRTRPRPEAQRWYHRARTENIRPSAHICSGTADIVLIEGPSAILDDWERRRSVRRAAPEEISSIGLCRMAPLVDVAAARITAAPERAVELAGRLSMAVRWALEPELGILHLASDDAEAMARACRTAARLGASVLRNGEPPTPVRSAASRWAPGPRLASGRTSIRLVPSTSPA